MREALSGEFKGRWRTLDDLPLPQCEGERLVAVKRAVELRAIRQGPARENTTVDTIGRISRMRLMASRTWVSHCNLSTATDKITSRELTEDVNPCVA